MRNLFITFFMFLIVLPEFGQYSSTRIESAKLRAKKKNLFKPLLGDEGGAMTKGDFIAAMDELINNYIDREIRRQVRANISRTLRLSPSGGGLSSRQVDAMIERALSKYEPNDRQIGKINKTIEIIKRNIEKLRNTKANQSDIERIRKNVGSGEGKNTTRLVFGTLVIFGALAILGNR